jgi:predicted acetyltransferase
VSMRLTQPDARFHRSFLAAVDEFVAAGEERYVGLAPFGAPPYSPEQPVGHEFTRDLIADPAGFAGMIEVVRGAADPASPRPRGYVPWTELWMTDGEEYLGRITLRHELNEVLFTWGGHIGYAVRPSARRRGHASAALRQMLETCRDRGIDPVLITCDVDNEGSRRTIEAAGGQYEDTREGKLRFWITLP